MTILASRLRDAGFRVVSFGYPSTSEEMEALVDRLDSQVAQCCGHEAETVHFVTHSMGGILVRSYLDQQPEAHQGRVVMLSPPSQGSEVVDAFADSPMLRAVLGPAGSQLGTDSTAIPSRLGPVRFSLGIITGNRSLNPLYSWLIPGPDDGKVGVDRAKVEGAAGFLVVPASHTFIMNRGDVAEQVVFFLRHGRFRPPDP
jgi:pimeloyl-ACP methyl ester carboxylesterase